MLLDVFRHWVALFAVEETTVLSFAATRNPLNGNEMALTNHQAARSTFFTSTLFLVATVVQNFKRRPGVETALLSTRFAFEED